MIWVDMNRLIEKKNKNWNDCDSYLFYFHDSSFIYIKTLTQYLKYNINSNINSCTIKLMKYYYKIYTIYIKYII